jgi:23S rRNA (cytidine2498-2'-O)-methyltransferase
MKTDRHDPPAQHVLITRPGLEDHARAELLPLSDHLSVHLPGECTVPPGQHLSAGTVLLSGALTPHLEHFPLFFTRQGLPNAHPLEGESIRLWAHNIGAHLVQHLAHRCDEETAGGHPTSEHAAGAPLWSLHVFEPDTANTGTVYARQRHITTEVIAYLKRYHRGLLRGLRPQPQPHDTLVQVCCTTPTHGYISIADGALRQQLGSRISAHCAGYIEVPDDPTPPSRAYKKLLEAQSVFGMRLRRGQRCVDLGAAPGGWTHVALAAGCQVTAVDRSPLAPALQRNPRLTMERGDALKWRPRQPVDWLLCDVITTPDRTLRLLESWLTHRECGQFCVTLKWRGSPDFGILSQLRTRLTELCGWWDGKQLTHNKNEVTVVGALAAR